MKVLVAGANGTTGRLLIHFLKQDNHEAYGMVRKEEQKAKIEELGGTPILADLTGDVGHAVKGMDAVIFAAGSGSHTGSDQTTAVDRDGAINLIKATENFGMKKFVMLSAIAADEPDEATGTMKHYLQMKLEADQYLEGTELNHTIVRPGYLTNDEGSSKIKAAKKVERESIPRADVAKTMIASLEEPSTYNKTFELISGDTQIEEALKKL